MKPDEEASDVVLQMVRKVGDDPPWVALQVRTETMRIFVERGDSLSITGLVLHPRTISDIPWSLSELEVLFDHIRYRCVLEVPEDLQTPLVEDTLKDVFDSRFEDEFRAAKAFAPRLRTVLTREASRLHTSAPSDRDLSTPPILNLQILKDLVTGEL